MNIIELVRPEEHSEPLNSAHLQQLKRWTNCINLLDGKLEEPQSTH